MEYHKIEKEQQIVSENEKARTVSLVPRKYLLVWFELTKLDTEMLDRTDRSLFQRSDKMLLGWLGYA